MYFVELPNIPGMLNLCLFPKENNILSLQK
jgi:hypothetical protein